MRRNLLWLGVLAAVMASCSITPDKTVTTPKTLADFQREGAKFKNVVRLPQFETTTAAVKETAGNTMFVADLALDSIGKLGPAQTNFENTLGALDTIGFQIGGAMNRLALLKETSTNAAMRDAATDALKTLQEWAVGLDYREDVYRVVKAYADTKPKLAGEEAKLLEETMRDYRRAGLALPKDQRDEVERLRKELSNLTTDFDSNVTKAQKALKFTKADLEGVPESVLSAPGVKTGDDEYTIQVNVTWQYLAIMESFDDSRIAHWHHELTLGARHLCRFNVARHAVSEAA